ncbi:Ig-like domain repeat protein [Methylosinus sp. Sm6]|uniref:RCC1 domain-containing protein n=1 Tax=Methylosinus sp. Sm6 TaxID=2866948 RepID=UPI001C9A0109|nr:Ig-like domain repeat protein [Methylosinus sp. Sm6]MBY6242727.1 chromosome condensation regulator RCC1 [Methylosinus sp. Sm6]
MSAFRLLAVAALSLALAAPAFARDPSRMRLLAAPNPSKAGEAVTLTAEVDGLGRGAPTGKVSFSDGSVALGSGTLSRVGAGQAVLAAGAYHKCALTSAGGVDCWGWNYFGQLGDGTRTDRHTPTAVSGLSSGVIAITAGSYHSCALISPSGVKCWGSNRQGQLGDGTRTDRHTPVSVSGLSSGVVAITAGLGHTCALTHTGRVKCWGDNSFGRLGDGTERRRLTPVSGSGLRSGFVAITAGLLHSCALTSAGGVKCWGHNVFNELGNGDYTARFAPVPVSGLSSGVAVIASSAGSSYTCALTSSGAAKCWGYNGHGQLGDGAGGTRGTPVAVSGLASGVAAIAPGGTRTCALTSSGAVKCWGGTTTDSLKPAPVPGLSSGVFAINSTCALSLFGAAKCWGDNDYGQIGDGTTIDRLTPTPVSGFTALVRARATLSTSALAVGTHALQARFPGDANHLPSSAPRVQTVVP